MKNIAYLTLFLGGCPEGFHVKSYSSENLRDAESPNPLKGSIEYCASMCQIVEDDCQGFEWSPSSKYCEFRKADDEKRHLSPSLICIKDDQSEKRVKRAVSGATRTSSSLNYCPRVVNAGNGYRTINWYPICCFHPICRGHQGVNSVCNVFFKYI